LRDQPGIERVAHTVSAGAVPIFRREDLDVELLAGGQRDGRRRRDGVDGHRGRGGRSDVVLAAGSYDLLVGLSDHGQSIQQIRAGRLDVSAENAKGSYELTSGAGMVLNSMKIDVARIKNETARPALETGAH